MIFLGNMFGSFLNAFSKQNKSLISKRFIKAIQTLLILEAFFPFAIENSFYLKIQRFLIGIT